jgi:hypothetical protein
MEALYKNVIDKNTIALPIIKIDNIPVSVKINVLHNLNNWQVEPNTIYLEIRMNQLYLYDDTASTYEEFEQMMNSIKNMKFDTFSGEFYTPTAVTSKCQQPSCYPMPFLESPNVEVNYAECCVCFHQTVTTTTCNHYLCHGCRLRLRKEVCPLCRNTLTYAFTVD